MNAYAAGDPAGPELRLRDAHEGDLARLLAWREDPVTLAASFDMGLPSPDAHAAWFAHQLADPDRLCLILEIDGEPAGSVRFAVAGNEAALGYALAARFRGRRLGTALVDLGLEWVRRTRADVSAVIADVRPENTGSLRTLERLGFVVRPVEPAADPRPGTRFVRLVRPFGSTG